MAFVSAMTWTHVILAAEHFCDTSSAAKIRFRCAQATTRGVFGGGGNPVTEGTLFVCNDAVTPGPSHELNITFFVKDRPKSA